MNATELNAAAIDTAGFRFADLDDWKHADFLPGAIKYGDVPTLLALSAPNKLWIGGEQAVPPIVTTAYKAAGMPNTVANSGSRLDTTTTAVDYILEQ